MRFRKKPVVIEAKLFTVRSGTDLAKWCGGMLFDDPEEGGYYISISTLEGEMKAKLYDWIIKGIQGEFYHCKQDIFTKTYEQLSE